MTPAKAAPRVISFEAVAKHYPDGTTAVDGLTLEVPDGDVVVLVGPSGCGKTTSMRMVNRMVEPSAGVIRVDGEDIMSVEPAALRRRIGYVIQQIGLFPHRTIAQNIATVPSLLGWDKRARAARARDLIDTVGLPEGVADRYPHQLSGGQRQRVGVARALAADPSIMLMDEPFGAVDPIVRTRLQDEFLRLQREVRKTILFVTHDIDEAIRMGDRIAILAEGGRLQQYDTPERILAQPANDFVEEFLGAERGLKRLALVPVSQVKAERGPVVRVGTPRTEARRVAEAASTDWVVICTDDEHLLGWRHVEDLADVVDASAARPFLAKVQATDSLRAALDAMVGSRTGVAVRVSDLDRYEGMLTQDVLTAELLGGR